MKIVHVMDWYISNMGYQENFLPAEQKKLGFDVEIITSDRYPPYYGYNRNVGKILGKRIIGPGIFYENDVRIHRLKTIIEIKDGGILVLDGLKKTLEELKPDVVQAHGATCFSTLSVILYCKKMGYKVFVDDHSNKDNFTWDTIPKKIAVFSLKAFYKLFGNRVQFWMPVTFASVAMLSIVFKIKNNKMVLIPLGVNTNVFYKSELLRIDGRKEFKLNERDILIITAGKFSESKDIDILLYAFGNISKHISNLKLLLIGDGEEKYIDSLRDIIKSEKLENHVFFMNFVRNENLSRYYNAADIGVWPGANSITAIESVGTGLPIIIPENDLAYKILFNAGAALGFKRKNIDDLSQCITTLVKDEQQRKILSEHGIFLAENVLSWKKVAEKTKKIYLNKILTNTNVG